ncbi:hypothetical protein Tco_0836295 [Tanacetum coccineum]
MQRPPLYESNHFIYWKNRFETYVKAKDLDLWHIILNDDFPPLAKNEVTQILEVVPFEQQDDDLKKKLGKNNEAKMVLYNALPKKEYERIFMCKMAKDISQSLLITHQGNSQVKDNKIDLLVQQYEQFSILEKESIDSGFARFNTIITSLKALDEGFSSKNYVRKFLRALHPKWRAKFTVIEESKDLSSLALDELIGNLKKESSKDETLTSGSDDEEYAMAVRNFKKFFRRKGKFVRHLIGDCPKISRNKDQKAFIGGSWSDSENDVEDKTNDETCLMAQSSNVVIHIGGLKLSLEFENKQDVYTSTRNNFGKDVEDEVDMFNDDTSSLVGGGLDSKSKKTNEPSTGHVNNRDTLAKDRNWESDGSYASTFHAQGLQKGESKF